MSIFSGFKGNEIQPATTGLLESSARSNELMYRSIAGVGEGIAEGIKEYYNTKQQAEQARADTASNAEELAGYLQVFAGMPEYAPFVEKYAPALEKAKKLHGMSMPQVLALGNQLRSAKQSLGTDFQWSELAKQKRLEGIARGGMPLTEGEVQVGTTDKRFNMPLSVKGNIHGQIESARARYNEAMKGVESPEPFTTWLVGKAPEIRNSIAQMPNAPEELKAASLKDFDAYIETQQRGMAMFSEALENPFGVQGMSLLSEYYAPESKEYKPSKEFPQWVERDIYRNSGTPLEGAFNYMDNVSQRESLARPSPLEAVKAARKEKLNDGSPESIVAKQVEAEGKSRKLANSVKTRALELIRDDITSGKFVDEAGLLETPTGIAERYIIKAEREMQEFAGLRKNELETKEAGGPVSWLLGGSTKTGRISAFAQEMESGVGPLGTNAFLGSASTRYRDNDPYNAGVDPTKRYELYNERLGLLDELTDTVATAYRTANPLTERVSARSKLEAQKLVERTIASSKAKAEANQNQQTQTQPQNAQETGKPRLAPPTPQFGVAQAVIGKEAVMGQMPLDKKRETLRNYVAQKAGFNSSTIDNVVNSLLPNNAPVIQEVMTARGPVAVMMQPDGKWTQLTGFSENNASNMVIGTVKQDGSIVPKTVRSADGKVVISIAGKFDGTQGELSKFNAGLVDYMSGVSAATRLKEIIEVSGKSMIWNKGLQAEANNLVARIKAASRLEVIGTGAISDYEQRILESIIQNPTDFFRLDATSRSQVTQILDKFETHLYNTASVYGLSIQTNRNNSNQQVEQDLNMNYGQR